MSAGIYTPDGKLFASYRVIPGTNSKSSSIPSGQDEIRRLTNKEIMLVRSITFQGKPSGIVYIRSDVEELNERLERYAGMLALFCWPVCWQLY